MSDNFVQLKLDNSHVKWHTVYQKQKEAITQVWVCGYAWIGGDYLASENLAAWWRDKFCIKGVKPNEVLERELKHLNGSFALVIKTSDCTLAAVDRLRSIPLFYGSNGNGLILSNNADRVRRFVGDVSTGDLATKEFLLTGYVTGRDTLYPHVKQIQAGEFVSIRESALPEVTTVRYYRFTHNNYLYDPQEQLFVRMENIYRRVFNRLTKSIQAGRIVVPLSGGLDSRSIVVMLKRMGVEDVLCFSYGRPGNWESEISQEVAKHLGYDWYFVPSTRKFWYEWFRSEECWTYHLYGSGLTSLAHLQDWPAVWEMKKAGILSNEDVIVPGHSADFLAGSHIPITLIDKEQLQLQDLVDAIAQKHYSFWNWEKTQSETTYFIDKRILSRLPETRAKTSDSLVDLFECWDWQERQAKYIVNSVRIYEFWGYEWRIPLWDNEFMDFWSRVPLQWRINKKLYDSYLEEKLFPLYSVAGLYHSKPSSPTAKITGLIHKMKNPRLGRYQINDYIRMWQRYGQKFGYTFRSLLYLLNTATLNTSIFLSNLNKNESIYK